MEMASNEDVQKSTSSSNETDHEDIVPDVLNHGHVELKYEIAEKEARGIIEVIASTGKFWHEWDKLKAILSFQLKQVLSKYPETKMTSEQQSASLGETFTELEKRLEEALISFDQGPPFTLQRLCEILLDARAIYPNLSKLALALEKNLLVTSMLTISTDPYPHSTIEPNEPDEASEEPKQQSDSVENGIEHAVGDKDEVMVEVEEADINDNMTIDMEALEDIVVPEPSETSAALEDIVVPEPSETSATPTNNC